MSGPWLIEVFHNTGQSACGRPGPSVPLGPSHPSAVLVPRDHSLSTAVLPGAPDLLSPAAPSSPDVATTSKKASASFMKAPPNSTYLVPSYSSYLPFSGSVKTQRTEASISCMTVGSLVHPRNLSIMVTSSMSVLLLTSLLSCLVPCLSLLLPGITF